MKQFFQNLFKKTEETKDTDGQKQCYAVEKKHAVVDDFTITSETFHELLQKRPQIKLIDVRRPEEFAEGHLSHAVLLPVQELSQEKLDAASVKKDDAILLYCRSGGRSGHALHMMQQFGYKNVKHLDGGILAWKEKNLSVEK